MLTLILVFVYARFNLNSIRKVMKELAMSLGWEFKGSIFSEAVAAGEYNGISTRIRYWPGSKYRTRYFIIELDITGTFEVKISKENFFHRLGKKTGLAREIETGDAAFDEKYFLKASDDYNAEIYMQKPQVRQTVSSILDTGFSIDMDSRKMKFTAITAYGKIADVFLLKTVLDNAYRLIKELP
jgi:hypothetical protein